MGLPIKKLLPIVGLTKNQYYHKPSNNKRGRQPTKITLKRLPNGGNMLVDNKEVIDFMVQIKSDPDLNSGYRAMTKCLHIAQYIINHKKVYSLMKDYHLLEDRRKSSGRNYDRYKTVNPSRPLECLEMDIKFIWVEQHQRFAYVLTVIDCFTRFALGWTVGYSIKQAQVKGLWDKIISQFLQPNDLLNKRLKILLRNDNDSRFSAKSVQEYFEQNHIHQFFTHPYTPQENGHIESFHSILSKSLADERFLTIHDLEIRLVRFYTTYNYHRLHGSIDYLSPSTFWALFNQDKIEVKTLKNGTKKFKCKLPHHLISGNESLREVSCIPVRENQINIKVGELTPL